ncbi:hypothetical protein [uncultured Tateyamaria sp.]|uniref:hypothetical protein n=1 Tax=uncultured Tateyamaria sp. TaxID=455651 RepID=UPI002626C92B|nr:hypothetical protein [uncultured Tateyamaria sp.]
MSFRSLITVLVILLPTALAAQRFFYKELVIIPVRPIDKYTFEAVENDGAGGTQIWCAAGKFTRDYLRQRGGDITVLTPRAASNTFPGRKSVIFTTNAADTSVRSTSQGVRQAGQTFSMAHAYALCRSRFDLYVKVRVIAP